MDSTQRIKPRDLVVGGRYLHRNGLFIREIEAIEGNRVHYHDQETKGWSCSNSVFVRVCPTVATAEDDARAAEQYRKLARLTHGAIEEGSGGAAVVVRRQAKGLSVKGQKEARASGRAAGARG